MSENLQPETDLTTKKRIYINKKRSLILTTLIITLSAASYLAIHVFFPAQQFEKLLVTPEIVTGKKITLKKLKPEYFLDYHNMLSNTVRKGLEWPKNITLDWTINELKAELKKEKTGTVVMYCIFDNKENKLIGFIDIRDPDPNDLGQFGVWVNENYWGSGRMQEATKLISQVYFALKNEDSYIAHVRLWNQRSYHALKKFGFQDTGFFYENGQKTRHVLILHKKDVK
ncbi:MAG: GNAT family N-acetyltransferase [bacterium]